MPYNRDLMLQGAADSVHGVDAAPQYADWANFEQSELSRRKQGTDSMYNNLFDSVANTPAIVSRTVRSMYDGPDGNISRMDGMLEKMRAVSDKQAQGGKLDKRDAQVVQDWQNLLKSGYVPTSGY